MTAITIAELETLWTRIVQLNAEREAANAALVDGLAAGRPDFRHMQRAKPAHGPVRRRSGTSDDQHTDAAAALTAELVDALTAARSDAGRLADLIELWNRADPDTLTAALTHTTGDPR